MPTTLQSRVVVQISRRAFLQLSTGASISIAVPSLLTAVTAQGLRVAFVGLGRRGVELIRAAQKVPGLSIAALCDPDGGALHRALSEISDAKRQTVALFRDAKELLYRANADTVIVSVPARLSAHVASVAASAGGNAYLVPPLLSEIDDMGSQLELLHRNDGRVHVHLSHPHDLEAQIVLHRASTVSLGRLQQASILQPWDESRDRLLGEINALDFVLQASAGSEVSEWRSVVVEPRSGPSARGITLTLTPATDSAAALTIAIVGTNARENTRVVLAGSRGRLCCELKPQHHTAFATFMARRLSSMSASGSRATAAEPNQGFARTLFASVLATLVSESMRTLRPFEMQFV